MRYTKPESRLRKKGSFQRQGDEIARRLQRLIRLGRMPTVFSEQGICDVETEINREKAQARQQVQEQQIAHLKSSGQWKQIGDNSWCREHWAKEATENDQFYYASTKKAYQLQLKLDQESQAEDVVEE